MDAYLKHRTAVEGISHFDAEICVNAWYFVDATNVVARLAVKAYALTGSDEEKLTLLHRLSATDHLTAIHGRVSKKCAVIIDGAEHHGAAPLEAVQANTAGYFDEMLSTLEEQLPEQFHDVGGQYFRFKPELNEPLLWVVTCVYENPDGRLLAMLSNRSTD
jgi:hypothetical protein